MKLLTSYEVGGFLNRARLGMARPTAETPRSGDMERDRPISDESLRLEPTRAAGLDRLHAFLPFAGCAYAQSRNFDYGPQDRGNISGLSPWIRRRLLTEAEVVDAALRRHGFEAAQKFVEEVFWRSYWKGHLETRPEIFARYVADLDMLDQRVERDAELRALLARAEQGATGIDCFDVFAHELIATGYLHNHARMWFASIWIFTLNLPWRLGAAFFHRHLIDADIASNTLSWRWVAGLHTPGKHYVARAENIRRHTRGRFDPRGLLDEAPTPLTEPHGAPPPRAAPQGGTITEERVALLLTEEDLHAESWDVPAQVVAVAALAPLGQAPPESPAALFSQGALHDGLARAGAHFDAPATGPLDADAVFAWAKATNVREIVTAFAPVGFIALELAALETRLRKENIRLTRLLRPWDRSAWPYASAGFFSLRKRIPALLAPAPA